MFELVSHQIAEHKRVHGNGQFVRLQFALRRIALDIASVQYVGFRYRVLVGTLRVRAAEVGSAGTGTCRGLRRCVGVHVIEDDGFRVVVVQQHGVVPGSHLHDLALGSNVQHVVDSVLVVELYAQPSGNVGTQFVVLHAELLFPLVFPVGAALAHEFPFLFVLGLDMHGGLRCMLVVVETELLVLAGRGHCQHSRQQGNISCRVSFHFTPPFLLLVLPHPISHTSEISAFVGPNQWRFLVDSHT